MDVLQTGMNTFLVQIVGYFGNRNDLYRMFFIIDSWYYKNTSRNESEVIVENDGREGCFMVRDSSRRGIFTLTLLVKTSG